MTPDEMLSRPPTDEQIEVSLRRVGEGKVRRRIPVEPDDDDDVLSNAIDALRRRVATLRAALARATEVMPPARHAPETWCDCPWCTVDRALSEPPPVAPGARDGEGRRGE